MKTAEILLASSVLAAVAGAGAALATRAFESSPVRAPAIEASIGEQPGSSDSAPDTERRLSELWHENEALKARLGTLEQRLSELGSRTPLEAVPSARESAPVSDGGLAARLPEVALTPDFVASVDQALQTIQAREEAQRDEKLRALQADRVEDRVTRLQQELGLDAHQASEMRTTLMAQEQKRDALFDGMREGDVDPRELRDSFRSIRDETYTSFETFLRPDQIDAYRASEESEFRRGWGDFGRGPDGGPGARDGQRDDRRERRTDRREGREGR